MYLISSNSFGVRSRPPCKPITPVAPPLHQTVSGANSPLPCMCKLINEYSDLVDVHTDSILTLVRCH